MVALKLKLFGAYPKQFRISNWMWKNFLKPSSYVNLWEIFCIVLVSSAVNGVFSLNKILFMVHISTIQK